MVLFVCVCVCASAGGAQEKGTLWLGHKRGTEDEHWMSLGKRKEEGVRTPGFPLHEKTSRQLRETLKREWSREKK